MNFDLDEQTAAVADLAGQIFGDLATTERVKEIEGQGTYDLKLWSALADAGLVGVCLPEAVGGSDLGMVELAVMLEQQGQHVAPVPLAQTVLGAMTIAEHLPGWHGRLPSVVSGENIVTLALSDYGSNDGLAPGITAEPTDDGRYRIVGDKPAVPYAEDAAAVLASVRIIANSADPGSSVNGLVLIDLPSDGVSTQPVSTTNHQPQSNLSIDVVVGADRVCVNPDVLPQLHVRNLVATAAIQMGVCAGALAQVASYVSTREQFGRPLAAFQAVKHRAADGWITTEAVRTTALNAAWKLDSTDDYAVDVASAAYWASEGTQEVVLAAQHLHGGIGSDIDYPVHRYFLWGMQLANANGSASSHLAHLGRLVASDSGGN